MAVAAAVKPKSAAAAPAPPPLTPRAAAPGGTPAYLRASMRLGGLRDPQEHEAEHAAAAIAAGGTHRVSDPGAAVVRRTIAARVEDPAGHLRRKPSEGRVPGADAASLVAAARATPSAPLPPAMQARLEHGLGAPLGGVRVHKDATARTAAAAIGARAYTEDSRITLGHGESEHDVALMAHEATHVVQNRGAGGPIRRLGLDDVRDYLADKANLIPGYRMFTLVLGVNPINGAPVARSTANVLRAIVDFLPGGELIVQALDRYGIFDKAGAWIDAQIDGLGITASAILAAVAEFIHSLGLTDLVSPGGVWDRAERIFADPIARIIALARSAGGALLDLLREAVLKPIAALASQTAGWDLLTATLGRNPITGEAVPRTAETLIGGLMKLIGKEEVWENAKRANAGARLWAWMQGALGELLGFVERIPALFLDALHAFVIADLLNLPGAFGRTAARFGDFIGGFARWAGNTVWNLLEIVFDVVSPGALAAIKRTGAALKGILFNPLPFVGNLVRAAKQGFLSFGSNFGTHLKAGLIDWLTGSLPGVYIPQALSLGEIAKFALSVLGVTWSQIRGKIVKALGPNGETIMAGLETGFDIVVALVKGGPAAAWEIIKDKLTNLKDMVLEGISGFVIDTVVKKAVPKLVSLFVPGAGFVSAILSIYDTVMVFKQRLAQIAGAITAFVDSIVAIAAGQIDPAAKKVETSLAGLMSLAIGFLAGFLGLGNVASKISGVLEKIRAAVDKALDTAIAWIVGKAKSVMAKLFGKDGGTGKGGPDRLDATASQSVPLSLGEEGHTISGRVAGGKLVLEMASTSPGEMDIVLGRLNMLCTKALNEYNAALKANPTKKTKIEAERIRLEYFVKVTRKNYVGDGSIYKMIEDIAGGTIEPYINMSKADRKARAEDKLRSWLGSTAASLASDAKLGFTALEGFKFKSGYVDEAGILLPAYSKVRTSFYAVKWGASATSFQRSELVRLRGEAQKRDPTIALRPNKNDYYWSEDRTNSSSIPNYIANVTIPGDAPELDHAVPLGTRWATSGAPKPGNDTNQADRDANYQTDLQVISGRMNQAKSGPQFTRQVKPGFRGPADPP